MNFAVAKWPARDYATSKMEILIPQQREAKMHFLKAIKHMGACFYPKQISELLAPDTVKPQLQ